MQLPERKEHKPNEPIFLHQFAYKLRQSRDRAHNLERSPNQLYMVHKTMAPWMLMKQLKQQILQFL